LGGQSRIAWELAQKALNENQEVHLVGRRFLAGIKDNTKIQTHRVFQWPKFIGEWARFRSFAERSSRQAEKLTTGQSVIHGFGDSYRQDILTLGNVDWNYAKLIPGRRPDRTAVHVKTKSFLDRNLRFLVLESQQQRKEVLDLIPDFDQSKMRIIYPGVDPQRFQKYSRQEIRARLSKEFGIPPQTTWLVFAAGGDFEKRNLATLGKALLLLRHRTDWKMIFIGGRQDQIAWPRELGDRSYFLGRMDDIGTVLPGCDMLVYPAWYDEFALVCLESMASGLPLVVSRTVGASEVISTANKEVGILNDPSDTEKLAHLIENLLSNAPLRQRIAEENRKISQDFSWDNIYQKYKVLYNEVAANRPEEGK
jgi:UDP-glucose:(heptosyl)LPS alpha-1,3-glucosyltransferase